jgi:hypothetical protein
MSVRRIQIFHMINRIDRMKIRNANGAIEGFVPLFIL